MSTYVLTSPLPAEEILRQLPERTVPWRDLRLRGVGVSQKAPYEGKVTDARRYGIEGFRLRNLTKGNYSLVEALVTLRPLEKGSEITAKVSMPLFMGINFYWVATGMQVAVLLVMIGFLLSSEGSAPALYIFIPFFTAILAAGHFTVHYRFRKARARLLADLGEWFSAQLMEPALSR